MSARNYDRNGWFTVASNPISKVGVFEYRGASIGAPDPNKIYNVYRPASELARQETIDSFKLLPFVDDHTMLGKATPTSVAAERKGVHGVTGDNVVFDAATGTLNSNLKVWSDSLQKTIDKGKQDISMGYLAQYRAEQGVFDGKHYDYVQYNILGNHAALVHDGRMGKNVAVLDDALTVTFDAKDISVMAINQAWVDAMKARLVAPVGDKSIATLDAAVNAATTSAPVTVDDIAAVLREVPTLAGNTAAMDAKFAAMDAKLATVIAALDAKKDDDDDDDDMEDVMDASGKPVMDGATGKPMRQKKAKADNKDDGKMDKAAMDAAIAAATAPLIATIDSLKADGTKVVLGEISKRDALASQLKPFIGSFDHAEMTLVDVAKYGAKHEKVQLAVTDGTEVASITAWLHGRKPATPVYGVTDRRDVGNTGAKTSVDTFLNS